MVEGATQKSAFKKFSCTVYMFHFVVEPNIQSYLVRLSYYCNCYGESVPESVVDAAVPKDCPVIVNGKYIVNILKHSEGLKRL